MSLDQFPYMLLKKPCPFPDHLRHILARQEKPVQAFETLSGHFVFTNRRLILCERRSSSNDRLDTHSIPYESVTLWATANATGLMGVKGDWNLWTKEGLFRINLAADIQVHHLEQLIAECMFQS